MKTADNISEFTVYRLSIYKRCLEELQREKIATISSKDFAARFGLNSAQVRKDLAYFGEFGIRGMGYPVTGLREQILNILGLVESATDLKTWKTILIGAGNLGTALLRYGQFRQEGFDMIAAFDKHPDTARYLQRPENSDASASVPRYAIQELETFLAEHPTDIAMLAVPDDDAQEIVNRLVNAGIQAILNFVPVQLMAPAHVEIRTIDMTAELHCLTYHLNKLAVSAPSASTTPS